MADISVTAANVAKVSGAQTATGTAGAAITAGQPLYVDTANGNVLKLVDADASDLASTVAGIALHTSASGQPITYLTSGDITIGATLTAGKVYVASATAGGIAPVADLTTGWRTSILGYATTTAILRVGIINTLITN